MLDAVVSQALNLFAERRDRLSSLDASFLYLEGPEEPLHVGSLALVDGPVPFDTLAATVGARLAALQRYRQRPVRVPLDLSPPVWVDDPDFDPRRHFHRVTAPAPGGEAELHCLVDELFAAPLDPERPLWETYVIEGLAGGRTGVLSKVHHCMIDGVSGSQVMEVMTEVSPSGSPETEAAGGAAEAPSREPGSGEPQLAPGIAGRALAGVLSALAAATDPRAALGRARETLGAVGTLTRLVTEPIEELPFNGRLTGARRIVWASFALDDFLTMRGIAGCKVNDVVLAVIAGALRRYLVGRGVSGAQARVRALVPVSVRRESEHLLLGNRVAAMFVSLPVGVADPTERLRAVALELRTLKERGQPQATELFLDIAGAVPSPLAPWVTRLATVRPVVNTVCTNIPGPRETRYMLGRRMVELHPIVPLAVGIGLGFAILSYDGMLSICANTDPGLVPDAGRIPEALAESVEEMRSALGTAVQVAGTGRTAGPTVADLMSREVATLAAHDSLARAWEIMRQRRIRHLPVVTRDGRLIGIVTHRDLLAASQSSLSFRAQDERVRLLAWARAADVMETHLSTAAPGAPAAEAGSRMVQHKIGCLPVVDERGRLVGIITEQDFLRWATQHMGASAA